MKTTRLAVIAILCLGVHRSALEILQRRKRDWIIDSLEIDEGYNGSFPYSLGHIKLADDVRAFNLQGQGVDEDPIGVMSINEETGEITVYKAVDYEEYPFLRLTFEAKVKETQIVDMRLGVEVKIKDVNDNPPIFHPGRVEVTILESTAQGSNLVSLLVRDRDAATDNNNKFNMKIVSVTPQPNEDLEFYLEQSGEVGMISFKGCLDHETAEKYTIIVEAKDRGEKVQLSSSATVIVSVEDGNNHLPKFLGSATGGSVKETVENVLACRVQAEDADTRGTAAWRVKYQIHGDANDNFHIETDPETNDGLLYVKKPLDHEATPQVNLTLTLENEIPYYFCKVVQRTGSRLWQVSGGRAEAAGHGSASRHSMEVTVTVEDVNEAPVFDEHNKHGKVSENRKEGAHVARFTATDPDTRGSNKIVFMKGTDPAGWFRVDAETGEVTTAKPLDRESPYVKDGVYNITVLVADDGSPPMTGMATLTIHVSDENDNDPTLAVNTLDMCQSDKASVANISVTDLDGDPYGGPFSFKLLGDNKGMWRVHPSHGHSVNLVKESAVFSGKYDLFLEIADRQHTTSMHNLSVTVCSCRDPTMPNCRQRSTSGSTAGGAAIGIVLAGILLLAAVLCIILVTCKRQTAKFPEETYGNLIESNSESPGTDCKVALGEAWQKPSKNGGTLHTIIKTGAETKGNHNTICMTENMMQLQSEERNHNRGFMRENMMQLQSEDRFLGASSVLKAGHQYGQSLLGAQHFSRKETIGASSALNVQHQGGDLQNGLYQSWMTEKNHSASLSAYDIKAHRKFLLQMLNKKLYSLQTAREELGDYDPHVYADEEAAETLYKLDTIPVSEVSFDPDMVLDHRFNNLASISTTHQLTKTTSVHKPVEVVLEHYHLQN